MKVHATTPTKITSKILELCRSITSDSAPSFVPVKTFQGSKIDECFYNVKDYVLKKGGRPLYGYTIWEWPNVLLEAEFHCIWESEQKELIDVSKKRGNEKKVLFLPDESKHFNFNSRIREPNIRLPLSTNSFVAEFIEIANTVDSLSLKPGPVSVPEALLKRQAFLTLNIWALNTSRNEQCPCGSGRKFKKCCLRLIR
ncbi:MAG: SEC-C domain-containing protein [Proteobacteria bacterium]|nr:SEC-C domain-containing protein [Pseudomonadota bacterium]MBU1450007.1 SEC-C domain-containing protein [Pseudomonadota bacterium]MBU2470527.1 SEC-C domain-containing protein [Pseudomonadota bacterium]